MIDNRNATERDLAFVQWIEDRFHHEHRNETADPSQKSPLVQSGSAGNFDGLMREPDVTARLAECPPDAPLVELFRKAYWNVAG